MSKHSNSQNCCNAKNGDISHPDYVEGLVSDGAAYGKSGGKASREAISVLPIPGPQIPIKPPVLAFPAFCGSVSGKYSIPTQSSQPTRISKNNASARMSPVFPIGLPPFNLRSLVVRVDVDRFFPQKRISVELTQLFPRKTAHVIAEVYSDRCKSYNNRIIKARIVYSDGEDSLFPGSELTFKASRNLGLRYGDFKLTVSGGRSISRTYNLKFESKYFDSVEFEVDCVANAGNIVTAYKTAIHPNKPSNLPAEKLSLKSVFQRAGFKVSMSSNSSVIPVTGAGSNATWSDSEMHNAMVTYWSKFAGRPFWGLWVLYAARHDQGRNLGGIMFDDIGSNHRQGTAIFTDSFIQDAPNGDANPIAWRKRMQFWTAIHEMGHAFNLAHSWQKALGNPWLPLPNEPESRSFMNYPFNVSGGERSFFSDFRFRFSDDELQYMRHAPRRFVQMGNSNWFENHGFEEPETARQTGNWKLTIRANRKVNTYRFLEPVMLELKLENSSGRKVFVNKDMLADGKHINIFVQKSNGSSKRWTPLVSSLHKEKRKKLKKGHSIYGSHMISASSGEWLIDEPGFYKVQAAVDLGDEIVLSNVWRVFVESPVSHGEASLANDFFTEDMARTLTFSGAPSLSEANDTLRRVSEICSDNPVAKHAEIALSTPLLTDFKILDVGRTRDSMAINTIRAQLDTARAKQESTLLDNINTTADTLGHIKYFSHLRALSESLANDNEKKHAIKVVSKTIKIMKRRGILQSVISEAEERTKQI